MNARRLSGAALSTALLGRREQVEEQNACVFGKTVTSYGSDGGYSV